jgi:micrococcal nuclease
MTALLLALLATPAHLVGIVDGDTLRLTFDLGYATQLTDQRIRLCGIDTPEMRGPESPLGKHARDVATQWVTAAKRIDFFPAVDKDGHERKDSFGRWLGWVELDGVDLSARLMAEGLGGPTVEKCERAR